MLIHGNNQPVRAPLFRPHNILVGMVQHREVPHRRLRLIASDMDWHKGFTVVLHLKEVRGEGGSDHLTSAVTGPGTPRDGNGCASTAAGMCRSATPGSTSTSACGEQGRWDLWEKYGCHR